MLIILFAKACPINLIMCGYRKQVPANVVDVKQQNYCFTYSILVNNFMLHTVINITVLLEYQCTRKHRNHGNWDPDHLQHELSLWKLTLIDFTKAMRSILTPEGNLHVHIGFGLFERAVSQGFCSRFIKTLLKIMIKCLLSHTQCSWNTKRKASRRANHNKFSMIFLQGTSTKLENFRQMFSSCKTFPSWPSVAKDTY